MNKTCQLMNSCFLNRQVRNNYHIWENTTSLYRQTWVKNGQKRSCLKLNFKFIKKVQSTAHIVTEKQRFRVKRYPQVY